MTVKRKVGWKSSAKSVGRSTITVAGKHNATSAKEKNLGQFASLIKSKKTKAQKASDEVLYVDPGTKKVVWMGVS